MEAPPNFSLALSRGTGADRSKMRFLHRAHVCLIRTRWRSRALHGLLGHLDEFLPRQVPVAPLQVSALALVKDGRAYLVQRAIEGWLDQLSPPLHRAGFQFVDRETVWVDPESRALIVPPLQLESDASALPDLDHPEGGRSEPAFVPPGGYPIDAFAYFVRDPQAPSVKSALLQLFQSTTNAFDLGIPETLRALEPLASSLHVRNLSAPNPEGLAAEIAALATG